MAMVQVFNNAHSDSGDGICLWTLAFVFESWEKHKRTTGKATQPVDGHHKKSLPQLHRPNVFWPKQQNVGVHIFRAQFERRANE